jgi:translation initiation factor 5
MSLALANIPRRIEDTHYRYTMPVLVIKTESRGNGVKTRFENIKEISKSLDRSQDHILKFLAIEVGAAVKENDGVNMVISGKHEVEELAAVLDKFIDRYILCEECSNPETELVIKKSIRLKCKACGHTTRCDESHKIANIMFRTKTAAIEVETEAIKDEDFGLIISGNDEAADDDDWAVPTDPESVAKRQAELGGVSTFVMGDEINDGDSSRALSILSEISPTANPLPILNRFWSEKPAREIILKIQEMAKTYMWSNNDVLKNIFASMWMDFGKGKPEITFEGAILKAKYFGQFIYQKPYSDLRPSEQNPKMGIMVTGASTQKAILAFMEKMATEDKRFAMRFPDILNLYYTERILEQDMIEKWYSHSNPKMPEKISKFIRDRSEVFVGWLKNTAEE